MLSHVTAARSLSNASRRSLLSQGISVVSAVAILSGGTVWAQSADPALEAAPESTKPPSSLESAPLQASTSTPRPIAPIAPESFPTVEAPLSTNLKVTAPTTANTADDRYIDSTSYSIGATEPSSSAVKRPQLPSVTSPLNIGSNLGSAAGDYSVTSGRSIPSVKDYYYRTLRPPAMLGNGNIRLIFPLSIPAPITSLFGWRIHPVEGGQRFHSGTDLGAPMGTPVLAAYAGKVALADFLGGYGLAVAVEHNKGTQQTLYGHLSEIFVKPGDWVKQGMVIGRVGSTGLSTGPHLHFEFRQLTPEGWVAMDPGAQLEYALAQLVKSFDFAQAKPGEDLGLGGRLGAVNVGAKGDITLQVKALKQLSQIEAPKQLSQIEVLKQLNREANAG
ncbi:peptidoglycan DD-metalloendopeptidase family protein [Stenomitos frigidus]|uniref:Metalloendopeptidase n=1 Tax=Stenomitos frigidus ULC18 TaxID=2107698 RepID=A0A2T1E2M6_9CYAN|nr:peptidoglycan DD-metalloendopeptidase family protein [Stenomitos frigidus]PSB26987.1 metalloendopeptidase [Stenomitos frigidus ULC18]